MVKGIFTLVYFTFLSLIIPPMFFFVILIVFFPFFFFFIPFNPNTRLQWHCFTLYSKVKCA